MKFKIAPNLKVRRSGRKRCDLNCKVVSYSRSRYPRSQYASITQSDGEWYMSSSNTDMPTVLRRKYA